MRRRDLRLSTMGYVVCLILSLLLAATAQGWRSGVACAVIVALAAVFCPAGLAALRSSRLWLFLVLMMAPAAIFLGGEAQPVVGLRFSAPGLAAGAVMAVRAVSIMVAVSSFAASVSVSDLSQLFERIGLRGIGFALGVAVNMLPTIQSTLVTSYQSLRLRGGFRRPVLGLRLLLVTVAANSLRHADDIIGSAEARAFSPERVPVTRLVWSKRDAWATSVLVATMLAIWMA